MAVLDTIGKLMRFAPFVVQAVQGLRGKPADVQKDVKETQDQVADLKKHLTNRLEAVEEENAHLRRRLRDTDASLTFYKAFFIMLSAFSLAALIMAIIAIVR